MKRISYDVKHKYKTKAIDTALKVLRRGGLIVSPSDTVYGLLVDATNNKAVEKLIKFKNRVPGKPISVFVSDFQMLNREVETNKEQREIIEELLPGPFSIILKSKHKVLSILESEKGNLAVRIPDYSLLNSLVKKFDKPITATSANLSGKTSHYSINSLLAELPQNKINLIDLIVDAGELPRNKPSTVIDLTGPSVKFIRKGDIVFSDKKTYISDSPSQTMKLAKFIFKKFLNVQLEKSIVFILEGDLGVGKTVFIKGIGDYLGIKNIISPTYVVYYEYYVPLHATGEYFAKKLLHIDLYNIQDPEEFQYLHLDKYLEKGNILCFEWGEKAAEIIDELKDKGQVVYIKMKYVDETKREINVNY